LEFGFIASPLCLPAGFSCTEVLKMMAAEQIFNSKIVMQLKSLDLESE
jgi:hypothetical protein